FGSLDAIYAGLDQVKKPRIRESLKANEADARLSQQLVTLHTGANVSIDLEALRYGSPDVDRLRELFNELGFARLSKALPAPQVKAVVLGPGRGAILTREALEEVVREARSSGKLAIAARGLSPEPMRAGLFGIALAAKAGSAAYVPIGHRYL